MMKLVFPKARFDFLFHPWKKVNQLRFGMKYHILLTIEPFQPWLDIYIFNCDKNNRRIFHDESLTYRNQSIDFQSKNVALYFPIFKVYKSQTWKKWVILLTKCSLYTIPDFGSLTNVIPISKIPSLLLHTALG